MRKKAIVLSVLITTAAALVAGTLIADDLEREVPAQAGGELTVELQGGGDITITGWDRNAVEVVADNDDEDGRIEVEATANGVRVRSSARGGEGWWGGSSQSDVEIKVPRNYDADLETMGGDVEISGVSGTFRGQTMGGDIELNDLEGEVKLTTMGGDIELTGSRLDGSLTTMGGKVLFEDVEGDVDGKSMGGNVILRNVRRSDGSSTGDMVKISTMGGDVEVDDAPAGADLHTMGGDIEVGRAAGFVKAKTMGGDIELEAIDGWIEATTMGGDIEARMVGDVASGDRHVELTSMSGDVELIVPAGLSMAIDVELAYTKNSSKDYEIESDFDLEISETSDWSHEWGSPRKVIRGKATLGGGEHKVKIRTVNGDVVLKKG